MPQNFIENFEKKSQNKGFHVCLFSLQLNKFQFLQKEKKKKKKKKNLNKDFMRLVHELEEVLWPILGLLAT
jgi:hypothetical protein